MEFSIEWWGRKHLKEVLDPDYFVCPCSKRVNHGREGKAGDKNTKNVYFMYRRQLQPRVLCHLPYWLIQLSVGRQTREAIWTWIMLLLLGIESCGDIDHTSWDVGNMGWSPPPCGLIISRTGHAWALVLLWKVCRNSGAKVNLTETCACVLSLLLFTSPFPCYFSYHSLIHSLTFAFIHSVNKRWSVSTLDVFV